MTRALLLAFPLLSIGYVVAVRQRLLPADPEVVLWLAGLPLLAAALSLHARAWLRALAAGGELGLAAILHGLVTAIRAWRLE